MKIRKGDQVNIIAGKDRGKSGKVIRVIPEASRIVVEGLNLVKRHVRPRRSGEKGQRLETPASLNVSNAMLVCPKCGKATRVAYAVTEQGKNRVCKQCKGEI
ncbi:50S ribosomal protein L24 [Patescibacteria group bacterium]|nr:MAG: 50S ribosomal protein L24 [Patescibacteria group bacterium]